MLSHRTKMIGSRVALMIRFGRARDVLELHQHTEPNFHDVLVERGAIVLRGPDGAWELRLRAGESYDIPDERQHHEIVALEDETIIANIYRGPMPSLMEMLNEDWVEG